MGKVYCIFGILGFLAIGCFSVKEFPVESDYSYRGDFKNYKTFSFVNTIQNIDSSTANTINETIKAHLELFGYTFIESRVKANFLVNYFYYEDALLYNGYSQSNLNSFIYKSSKESKNNYKYYKKQFAINNGIFVINFTDTKNYDMVWQGYTTDLYKDNIFTDTVKTRIAVISILNNFNFFKPINN